MSYLGYSYNKEDTRRSHSRGLLAQGTKYRRDLVAATAGFLCVFRTEERFHGKLGIISGKSHNGDQVLNKLHDLTINLLMVC